MSFIPEQNYSIYIIGVLCLIVWIGEWLGDKPYFRHLSTGLMVIMLGALAANTGLIPATKPSTLVYDVVFAYIAPLSIFLVLLGVDLRQVKKAGKPMLLMFFIGSAATIMGVVLSFKIWESNSYLGEFTNPVAGMLTGTYIGGSLNFNAVALHYNVSKEGDLFTAVTVADNVISAIWVMVTLAMPYVSEKWWSVKTVRSEIEGNGSGNISHDENEAFGVKNISVILALAIFAFILAQLLNQWVPEVPMILWLTTFALMMAQIPLIKKTTGHKTLGIFAMYLFLAVVGTHCDFIALMKDGVLALQLMVLVTSVVFIHGIIIYGLGYLLKQDKDVVSIASQANIGGVATALALSKSLNRNDLLLPSVIIGALGNASGTYYGIMLAEWMSR